MLSAAAVYQTVLQAVDAWNYPQQPHSKVFPFLTATDGASAVCTHVCVCACDPSCTQSGLFQPTVLLNFKSTRAEDKESYSSGTTPVNLTYDRREYIPSVGTLVFTLVKLRRSRRFKPNYIPKGNLVMQTRYLNSMVCWYKNHVI